MITVDVVCEAEHLPRLKLLQTHMRSLNVELQIHETVPEPCSERLIIVPRQRNSKLKSVQVEQRCERIALLLDKQTEAIEADMQVTLHSWPARSSDAHVETLARHLHSPLVSLTDQASATKTRTNTASQTARSLKQKERRKNILTISLLALSVFALFIFVEVGTNSPTEAEKVETVEAPVTSTTNQVDVSTDLAPMHEHEHEPQIQLVPPQEDILMHQLADSPKQDEVDNKSLPAVSESAETVAAEVLHVCTYPTWQDPNRTNDCDLVLF
jgi:hypothetical protein